MGLPKTTIKFDLNRRNLKLLFRTTVTISFDIGSTLWWLMGNFMDEDVLLLIDLNVMTIIFWGVPKRSFVESTRKFPSFKLRDLLEHGLSLNV